MKIGDVVMCTKCGTPVPCIARVLSTGATLVRVHIIVDLDPLIGTTMVHQDQTGKECHDPTSSDLRVLKPAEYLQYLL